MKKILIDGRGIDKKRGIGHYIRELVYCIDKYYNIDGYSVSVVVEGRAGHAVLDELVRVKIIRIPNMFGVIFWEQVILPIMALVRGVDILISPSNTFPVVGVGSIRRVVTIHDLMFLHWRRIGGSKKLKVGNLYRSIIYRYIKNVDKVLTVSSFTRDCLRKFSGINADVLENSCFHLRDVFNSAHAPRRVQKYFVHIGGDASTKNSRRSIDAYIRAASGANGEFPELYVIGVSQAFAREIKGKRPELNGIHFKHGIPDSEKCSLLKGAVALIFPSLREGYGLPIIEAHMVGLPVITSRRRPMSTLATDKDILVNPTCVESISSAMIEMSKRDIKDEKRLSKERPARINLHELLESEP